MIPSLRVFSGRDRVRTTIYPLQLGVLQSRDPPEREDHPPPWVLKSLQTRKDAYVHQEHDSDIILALMCCSCVISLHYPELGAQLPLLQI